MTTVGRGRTRACRSAGLPSRGARAASGEAGSVRLRTPDWDSVERLLAELAELRGFFPSATSHSNWISSYEPGRRLRLETDAGSKWIQVDDVRRCWDTFERLRRIRRADVLEPGRSSGFMMALFARVPGVSEAGADEQALLLVDSSERGDATQSRPNRD